MVGNDTVEDMVDSFDDYDAYYSVSRIPTDADRRDYIPVDTDDGKKNHSTMFLAYDTSRDPHWVWTVEGNNNNRVVVTRRTYDTNVMKGLGHILDSQLK